MTMAPQQDDLAARMDPTRIRARGFNTGKAARGGEGPSAMAWNETAEQKQKRLADEVLGISSGPKNGPATQHGSRDKARKDDQTAQRLRESAVSINCFDLVPLGHGVRASAGVLVDGADSSYRRSPEVLR